jgi:peptidoglycan hydrolase-like protein with peptidoglycan-binding domain
MCVSSAAAQTRITLPAGSVILVRTEQPLQSNNARVGQTFNTTVLDDVSADGYNLIPVNSRIRGVVAYVQPATRERSGVMQVNFDRVTLPDGTAFAIAGKLTSTDSLERRQIDSRADSRVVLVGERGGIGAAIAGAGSTTSSQGSILATLGQLLSEGRDVNVTAGTQLAVQLERTVTLTGRGNAEAGDDNTFYTAAERIRAAQQALARRAYYRGTANGVLDNPTRRALFEFQLDNNITATGNLDGRTAEALGILAATGGTNPSGAGVLSARDASTLRRNAQALTARYRQVLGITVDGRMSGNANVRDTDLELLFAFSALADNASLYEQLVRSAGNQDGPALAGRALINAARRVDGALQQARPSGQTRQQWVAVRRQLGALDPAYR